MKRLLTSLLLLSVTLCFAQRQYNVCDSTAYPYNTDTTMIAGKHRLWYQTPAGLTLAHDFTRPDTVYYIRDFDIIRPDLWYTLVGRRNIGGESYLYRSVDRGQTWTQDTSFYTATLYDTTTHALFYHYSVNQVQKVGEDSIVLFMGYYNSGLVYSVDAGNSWHPWFRNEFFVHYQGLLECDSHYFLYGFEGDGFKAYMFAFPKDKIFTPNTAAENEALPWSPGGAYHPACAGWNAPGCIYAPQGLLSLCGQYQFFADTLQEACSHLTTTLVKDLKREALKLWPNPATDLLHMELPHSLEGTVRVKMTDLMGRQISLPLVSTGRDQLKLSLQPLPPGVYIVVLETGEGILGVKKLVKN